MVRGIPLEQILEDFGLSYDGHTLECAKEYGVNEVIDGFLYHSYEGSFSDQEVDRIVDYLEEEIYRRGW